MMKEKKPKSQIEGAELSKHRASACEGDVMLLTRAVWGGGEKQGSRRRCKTRKKRSAE